MSEIRKYWNDLYNYSLALNSWLLYKCAIHRGLWRHTTPFPIWTAKSVLDICGSSNDITDVKLYFVSS